MAANEIGISIEFTGEGASEKGCLSSINEPLFTEKVGIQYLEPLKSRLSPNSQLSTLNSQLSPIISVDPKYYRPTEVDLLIGDPTKAMTKLGWKPRYDLQGLVTDMMQSDIHLMKKDAWLRQGGYRTLNYFE
jgi:GDPmannose 4,6-dehydratase